MDIRAYQSKNGVSDQEYMSSASNKSKSSSKISAWRGNNLRSRPPSTLRSKDAASQKATDVISLLRATDPALERAITARFYRLELAKDQVETKLSEWVQVATELQKVVQEQQRQLESITKRDRSLSNKERSECSNMDRIAESLRVGSQTEGLRSPAFVPKDTSRVSSLRELVRSVRKDLDAQPGETWRNEPSWPQQMQSKGDAARLQSEIAALRRQLTSLQQSQRSVLEEQREEFLDLRRRFEDVQREKERLRIELEHIKDDGEQKATEMDKLKQALEIATMEKANMQQTVATWTMELKDSKEELRREKENMQGLSKEKEEALMVANDATSELEKLQSQLESSLTTHDSMKLAAEQAGAEVAALESKIRTLEATLSVERSRRSGAEAAIQDMQAEMMSSKDEAKYQVDTMRKTVNELKHRVEALEEELQRANCAEVDAINEAEALSRQAQSLKSTNKALKETIEQMRVKLQDAQNDRENVVQQMAMAEVAAEERVSAAARQSEEFYKKEIAAMKEILTKVSDSAQERAKEMEKMRAQMDISVQKALEDAQHQIEEERTSAQRRFQEYEKEIQRLRTQGDPVKINLVVEDQETQVLREELAAERQGHALAVKALEQAHEDSMDSLQRQLEQVVMKCEQYESTMQDTSQIHILEAELLNAQNQGAHLNAIIKKLRQKNVERKEELSLERSRAEAAEETIEKLTQKLEEAESIVHKTQQELADAHDEIETLLKARIRDLSRAPSECGRDVDEDSEDNCSQKTQSGTIAISKHSKLQHDEGAQGGTNVEDSNLFKAVHKLQAAGYNRGEISSYGQEVEEVIVDKSTSAPSSSNFSNEIFDSSMDSSDYSAHRGFSKSAGTIVNSQMGEDAKVLMEQRGRGLDPYADFPSNLLRNEGDDEDDRTLREIYQSRSQEVDHESEASPCGSIHQPAAPLPSSLCLATGEILMPPPAPRRSPLKKLASMFRGKKARQASGSGAGKCMPPEWMEPLHESGSVAQSDPAGMMHASSTEDGSDKEHFDGKGTASMQSVGRKELRF